MGIDKDVLGLDSNQIDITGIENFLGDRDLLSVKEGVENV
jgi:hypothetical protein